MRVIRLIPFWKFREMIMQFETTILQRHYLNYANRMAPEEKDIISQGAYRCKTVKHLNV